MSDAGFARSRSTPGVSVRKIALSALSAPATADAAVSALTFSQPARRFEVAQRRDDRQQPHVGD